ncbi:MAG: polymer-forming cytoskeletal protein [Bacteroidota bacterium]
MFSKNANKEESFKTSGSTTTIIGTGTHLKGDLSCQNDLRIDGKLTGNIYCEAKVVIGTDGLVEGEVNCQNADVMGRIIGNIKVNNLLDLRGKADIKGDIFSKSLQVEPQVTFNGSCHMGANVVEMNEKKAEVLSVAK